MVLVVVVILNVVVAVINGGGNVHNGRGKVGGVIGRMAMSLLEHHLSRRSPPRFSGICRRRLRS